MSTESAFWTKDELLRDAFFQTPNESALPQAFLDCVLQRTYHFTHVERPRSLSLNRNLSHQRPPEYHVVFVPEERLRHILGSAVYEVGDGVVVACVPITLLALFYTFGNLLRPHAVTAFSGVEDDTHLRRLLEAQKAWQAVKDRPGMHLAPPELAALVAKHSTTVDRLRGLAEITATYRHPVVPDRLLLRLLTYAVEFIVLHEIGHVDILHLRVLADDGTAPSERLSPQDWSWCAEIDADRFALLGMYARRLSAHFLERHKKFARNVYEEIQWSIFALFTLMYLIDLHAEQEGGADTSAAPGRLHYPAVGVRRFFLDAHMKEADTRFFLGAHQRSWAGFVACMESLAKELGWTALQSAVTLPLAGHDDRFADARHVAAALPRFYDAVHALLGIRADERRD